MEQHVSVKKKLLVSSALAPAFCRCCGAAHERARETSGIAGGHSKRQFDLQGAKTSRESLPRTDRVDRPMDALVGNKLAAPGPRFLTHMTALVST